MTEQWRAIPGIPDYDVSDLGRVRSWKRRGLGGNRCDPIILASGSCGEVWMTIDGTCTSRRVHKLQSEAFGLPRRKRSDAVLDETKVTLIRARRAAGEKIVVLAHEYGVSDSLIKKIASRRRWKHVA